MNKTAPSIMLLASLLAGCGSDSSPVSYSALTCPAVSYQSAIDEPSVEVIDNNSRFVELFAATDLNSQEDIPVVDFNQQVVVAIHGGERPSSGYEIRVTSVKQQSSLIVHYQTVSPSANCAAQDVITYPYCFIAIDNTSTEIEFRESAVRECGN
jgi:hypothetical protein